MNRKQWLALAAGAALLAACLLVAPWRYYLPGHLPAGWGPNARRFAGWSPVGKPPARVRAPNDALYLVGRHEALYVGQCALVAVATLIALLGLRDGGR